MTRHINATIMRSLLLSAFFIASSAIALPHSATTRKYQTAARCRRCGRLRERDASKKRKRTS